MTAGTDHDNSVMKRRLSSYLGDPDICGERHPRGAARGVGPDPTSVAKKGPGRPPGGRGRWLGRLQGHAQAGICPPLLSWALEIGGFCEIWGSAWRSLIENKNRHRGIGIRTANHRRNMTRCMSYKASSFQKYSGKQTSPVQRDENHDHRGSRKNSIPTRVPPWRLTACSGARGGRPAGGPVAPLAARLPHPYTGGAVGVGSTAQKWKATGDPWCQKPERGFAAHGPCTPPD